MAYRGIYNLRSAKEEIELLEWQRNELKKCKEDAEYFLRNYCYINTRDNGQQLFPLRPRQVQLLQELDAHRFIKGDWYRQSGFTYTCMAYFLWKMIFSDEAILILYMNTKNDMCKEEMAKFREMYINLPYWMQPGVRTWCNTNIELRNRSRIMALAVNEGNGRALSPNYLMIDDFGFLTDRYAMHCAQSIFPTIMSTKSVHLITGHSHKFGNQTPFNLMFWKNNEKYFYTSENRWDTDIQHDAEWAAAERTKIGEYEFERQYEGTICQSVVETPKEESPAPIPFWAGAIDKIPDAIRRTRWNLKFHSRRSDWETVNDHLSAFYIEHTDVEFCEKTYPALRILVRNDEGAVYSAMNLAGYVTADLNIFDWTCGNQVAATRYKCICLNSLIKAEPLMYAENGKEPWNTSITLIIADRAPIVDGKCCIGELADKGMDDILQEHLYTGSDRRGRLSIFLEDNCNP